MRSLRKITICVSVILVMAGCSKEEGLVNDGPVEVRFTTQVNDTAGDVMAGTRASDAKWGPNDSIGVYMFDQATKEIYPDAKNKKYITAAGDGIFMAAAGETIYYPAGEVGKVDFIAYYPYTIGISNYTYPVDLSDQSVPEKIDLLYTTTSGGYDKENPDVNLEFEHKLSKFVLKTTPGEGLTDLSGMTVTVKGMNTRAIFDLTTGDLRGNDMSKDMDFYAVKDGEEYALISFPASTNAAGEWKVEFKLGGNTYLWNVPATALGSGKEHLWTIEVQRVPAVLYATIKNWEVVNEGSGTAR